jgi:pantothenate kinase type III
MLLSTYTPETIQDTLFGSKRSCSPAAIAAAADKRPVRALTVYLTSTNAEHEKGLEYLFSHVPCRLFRLRKTDFFSPHQGLYSTLGVDRVATLLAAGATYGYPALVIDGGTAMTYTAADCNGKIVGGGIVPGLALRLQCLHDHTGALPDISIEELNHMVEARAEQKEPTLPAFAADTRTGMVSAILQETARNLLGIVQQFLKLSRTTRCDETVFVNKNMTVCLTGGDGGVLEQLLQPNHSSIIPVDDPAGVEALAIEKRSFKVERHKHLGSYGIQAVLREKYYEFEKEVVEVAAEEDTVDSEVASVTITPGTEQIDDAAADDEEEEEAVEAVVAQSIPGDAASMEVVEATAVSSPSSRTSTGKRVWEGDEVTLASLKKAKAEDASAGKKRIVKRRRKSYLLRRVAKYFDDELYFGTIDEFYRPDDLDLWHVTYDDGDQEDLELGEMLTSLQEYNAHKGKDREEAASTTAS